MFIDYNLVDTVDDIQIEIIDAESRVVATLRSDTIKVEAQTIENMSLNQVEYIVDNSLSVKIGMNRYKWDMTQTGPWHKDNKKEYKDGPSAKPGSYTIRMTAGTEVYTETFSLMMDPRIATHVSPADIDAQVALQLKVSTLLSNVRHLEESLVKEKKELKELKIKSTTQAARLEIVGAQLNQLKTKDGIYMQPMLVSQISYLYSMLNDTDQAPGKDAILRYEELKRLFDSLE